MNFKVFGPADERSATQLQTCLTAAGDGATGVLCADHHPGYSMPIGGVMAHPTLISPAAVGFDIACGNAAVRLPLKASDLGNVPALMADIQRTISFGVGRKNGVKADSAVLDMILQHSQVAPFAKLAADQLGTVGSGNHYVDIFKDTEDFVWIGVHFGSRGFGHKTASGYMNVAAGNKFGDKLVETGMDSAPAFLDVTTTAGQDYIHAMQLAGLYAYAGRDWVIGTVMGLLGVDIKDKTFYVHNHHNFAWLEAHNGMPVWTVRKGATPAFPGQRGFIGGSMGDDAVIVEGVDSPESAMGLYSTVHGAGRVMSRTEAAGKTKISKVWSCGNRDCPYEVAVGQHRRGADNSLPKCPLCETKLHMGQSERIVRVGKIDWEQTKAELTSKGIVVLGAGADEAPAAYKRLPEVLAHHAGTIKVLHTLTPLGVVMAGSDEFDPYKD